MSTQVDCVSVLCFFTEKSLQMYFIGISLISNVEYNTIEYKKGGQISDQCTLTTLHPLCSLCINPLPALTYQTVLDLNAACRSKRTEGYWLFSS